MLPPDFPAPSAEPQQPQAPGGVRPVRPLSPATPPLTLRDWRSLAADTDAWQAAVLACAAALETRAQPAAVLVRAAQDDVQARLAELLRWRWALQGRAGGPADAGSLQAALSARYPLWGVPFAVKDNIDVAGLPTTAACPAFAHTPATSATVVHRLPDAGAVLLAKTNLDQFATGLVGTRSPYGAPCSTWDAQRVSGGSSSGSAVLVAQGLVPFALGTDTAGSGRIPAGFNHIVGLKPTPGRVSTSGVLPACRSLDCVSVFALTVEDAAAVLQVLEGPDATDAYSSFQPGRFAWPQRLRVGVPDSPRFTGDGAYAAAWQQALQQLQALGLEPVPLDLQPLHEVAALLYEGPWVAERYAVVRELLDHHPGRMDPTVAAVIGRARGMTAVQAFEGAYALQAARGRCATLWQDVDLLMLPTAPGHPLLSQVEADPVGANAALGHYTNFVNLLGWSALAVPACVAPDGLPFGVTFVAPGGADAALAQWGQRWQAACAQPLGATGRAWGRAAGQVAGDALPLPVPATESTLRLAVVGAHLSGLPLNGQLLERRAVLRQATTTAAAYRLFALPPVPGAPRKPGLLRVAEGGCAIALEVWELPQAELGSFLALIPPPLGLGSIELASGEFVHGFLCEPYALAGAEDISAHGGWRAWLASR